MTKKADSALVTQAEQIRTETRPGANTAQRVGQTIRDIVDSKANLNLLIPIAWDLSTDLVPSGGLQGQWYEGSGVTTTLLAPDGISLLPTKFLAIAKQDSPTTTAHFYYLQILF